MRSAREIFADYTAALGRRDVDAAVACYTEDGTLSFPFWPLLGLPSDHTGHENIRAYLTKLMEFLPDIRFEDFQVHIDEPYAMFAECRLDQQSSTGRRVNFQYGTLVLAENGRMKLVREFVDQIPAAAALLPNGIADIRGLQL